MVTAQVVVAPSKLTDRHSQGGGVRRMAYY